MVKPVSHAADLRRYDEIVKRNQSTPTKEEGITMLMISIITAGLLSALLASVMTKDADNCREGNE